MPLNYASLEQVSGWRFLRHRIAVAIGRRNVRLVHDPSRNSTASLFVGTIAGVLILGICAVIAFIKPVGQIGRSDIVLDRGTGALYVRVGTTLHPALNMASARLIVGSPDKPALVPTTEILKAPIGPMVGILGAPDDLTVRSPADTGWALCDRLGSTGSKVVPRVTVIDGQATLGDWAQKIVAPQAALMTYGGAVFLVTDGHRSEIDLADKPVMLALGLPIGDLHPAAMSRALYEALTPTVPLRVPAVPTPGLPVGYAEEAGMPLVSGSVLRVADVAGDPHFFVALPAGVQRVPKTVATMIINAGVVRGAQVLTASSATVTALPQAVGFDVSTYPPDAVQLLDKAVEPVTCVMWRKTNGEPQAQVTTVSGRRLPIPVGEEHRVVPLVSAGPGTADAVYVNPGTTNFVNVTGMEPTSTRQESLWLIGDNGVRFGVPTAGNGDDQTLHALGLEHSNPTPAPWSVIRWLPAGPALSKASALTQHDTLAPDPHVAGLPTPKPGAGA